MSKQDKVEIWKGLKLTTELVDKDLRDYKEDLKTRMISENIFWEENLSLFTKAFDWIVTKESEKIVLNKWIRWWLGNLLADINKSKNSNIW